MPSWKQEAVGLQFRAVAASTLRCLQWEDSCQCKLVVLKVWSRRHLSKKVNKHKLWRNVNQAAKTGKQRQLDLSNHKMFTQVQPSSGMSQLLPNAESASLLLQQLSLSVSSSSAQYHKVQENQQMERPPSWLPFCCRCLTLLIPCSLYHRCQLPRRQANHLYSLCFRHQNRHHVPNRHLLQHHRRTPKCMDDPTVVFNPTSYTITVSGIATFLTSPVTSAQGKSLHESLIQVPHLGAD
ncbi:hypothetical protein HPB50_028359 [Hyalomma asiaticum]|nr:hypothetical protein HPB50_028359 [Hyalomma asiaticum]